MKIKLLITCMGYFAWGFCAAVMSLRTSCGLTTKWTIFVACSLFFFYVIFSPMQDLKDFISRNKTKNDGKENKLNE